MDWKILFAGALLLVFGIYAHSAELSGTCSNTAVQCELSINELKLCNDSDETEDYTTYLNGESAQWFNVIPNRLTLEPDECESLRVFTVANCYADPGTYSAQLVVQNRETVSAQCSLSIEQGHFVDVDIQPSAQTATQCEEKEYGIVVTNRTIVPSQNSERVDLEVTGLPKEWYSLDEQRIVVSKDNPETVGLKVRAPCDADFGNYDFKVKAVLPNPNFFDEDSATFTISQGQEAHMELGSGFEGASYDACVEAATEGKVTVTNSGKLADTYRLSLEGARFARLDREQLSLGPGESAELTVRFSETNQEQGEYDFALKLQSTLYDYSLERQFRATLQDCYNIEVEKLEGEAKACAEDKPTYTFSLKNSQTKDVELKASIEGIGAELNNAEMTISPGKTKQVSARLDLAGLAKEAKVSKKDIEIELLIDTSGSMTERVEGKTKMDVAKAAITRLVNNISQIDMGVRVFGQGELCENSEQLIPVSGLDIAAITQKAGTLAPKGKTPMVEALRASINDFKSGNRKAIILVSDGKETCSGNVGLAARELASKGIKVYAVGFDIDEEGRSQLEEIAKRTNGKYFDAKNAQELSAVLKEISQELDIIPAGKGRKTFTLKLESEHFTFEKDFSLEISDCYSAAFVVPELNVCSGVTKNETFTIANLGSEAQEFTMQYSPAWVKGPATVTVEGGKEKSVQFTATPPIEQDAEKFSVKAVSPRLEFSQEKGINYLPNASCFAVDIILLSPELDAATCQGQKQTLVIENRGVTAQNITLSADKDYVHIVDSVINVEPGERQEVPFFVSPPFDLPKTTFITITAETENGFATEAKIKLIVEGNEESFGLGEVDVRIRDINMTKPKDLNYDVEVQFSIYNDSNRTLEIFNVKTLDSNAIVQVEKRLVQPKQSTKARLLVDLPEKLSAETVTVPVSLETDEGTYTRNITFTYKAEEKKATAPPVSVGTGLFGLANLSTAILGVLILIVIALIAYSSYKAVHKEEGREPATLKPGAKETAAPEITPAETSMKDEPKAKKQKRKRKPAKKK